ncbi:hypothetical protein Q8F55_001711 [Vanrija albida]|uniref:Uncharacterized protein n=1 Tax=Vanrija albida TaxID=181172 RepID=A0ABR3Q7P8_9TREE
MTRRITLPLASPPHCGILTSVAEDARHIQDPTTLSEFLALDEVRVHLDCVPSLRRGYSPPRTPEPLTWAITHDEAVVAAALVDDALDDAELDYIDAWALVKVPGGPFPFTLVGSAFTFAASGQVVGPKDEGHAALTLVARGLALSAALGSPVFLSNGRRTFQCDAREQATVMTSRTFGTRADGSSVRADVDHELSLFAWLAGQAFEVLHHR